MSDDNRLRVNMGGRLTPRTSREIEVHEDIQVDVENRLTPMAAAGLGMLAVGTALLVIAAVMFMAAYPDTWNGIGVEPSETMAAFEGIVLTSGAGVTLLFLGATLYFHGRTVLGAGTLEQIQIESSMEEEE